MWLHTSGGNDITTADRGEAAMLITPNAGPQKLSAAYLLLISSFCGPWCDQGVRLCVCVGVGLCVCVCAGESACA